MSKHLLITFFLTTIICSIYAQTNYFYRSDFDTLKFSWGKEIRYLDGKLYLFGEFTRGNANASSKLFLGQHTLAGQLVKLERCDVLEDTISHHTASPSIQIDEAGNIYAIGSSAYAPYRASGNVYKFDSNGLVNHITQKEDSDIYYRQILLNGGALYGLGQIADTFLERSDIFLTKFDTALNIIWQRKWGVLQSDLVWGIFAESDSMVVFAASSGELYDWDGHVMKVDQNGNLRLDKYDLNVLGKGELHLMDYSTGGNYYLFRKNYFTQFNQVFKMEIFMTDTAFNLTWKKQWTVDSLATTNQYDIWNVKRVKDGFVFCGNKNVATEGWLFKVNLQGEMQWEATYSNLQGVNWPPSHFMFVSGIDTSTNGSYVLSGCTVDSLGRTVAFIMSVDSNGCFSQDTCESVIATSIVSLANPPQVSVFPSPASGSFFVEVDDELIGGTASIFATNGLMVKQVNIDQPKLLIDAHELNSGLYLVCVRKGDVVVYCKIIID